MSSHTVFAELRKHISSPKETSYSLVSKIAVPLKTHLEILPWNFTEAAEGFIIYCLTKGPEQSTET